MTDRDRKPSLSRQADLLGIGRGSQFTSIDFIETLEETDIELGMDGKGAWRDNVFVERLWRPREYEKVYPHASDSVSTARESLGRYPAFHNGRRSHSSLHGRTPERAYLNPPRPIPVAA